MKKSIILFTMIFLFTNVFASRATGYAISDPVSINTMMGQTGYAISDPVSINTMGVSYSDYRIVEVSQAPNPTILQIPDAGVGYAWFVVEGETNGSWLPVPDIDILAEDGQGNIIQCQANFLPFQFLTAPYHFQNAGVFCIPIPADMVGDGCIGAMETFTVITANGEQIAPTNQQSITAEIIPYEYTASWGYRIYAQGGAGLTGGVVTATGFAGGGSGSKMEILLEGLDSNPSWNSFKIYRRDDLFVGAELSLGPPTLINTNTGASATVTASFPYEHEFDFDLDDLEGLEALMAYYLFAEPSIIYGTSTIPGGQIATNFLSWSVEALIENSGQNGLGIVRVADETGLDIEGSISFSTNILEGLPMGMNMGASMGASAHLGGSKKIYEDGIINRRLYVGGGYDVSAGIGPQFIPAENTKCKMIYPFRMNQNYIPSSMEVNFAYLGTWQNTNWQSTQLSASLASNSSLLNIYDLPGQTQEYTAWLNIDNTDVKNILMNTAELPSELINIGSSAVDVAINNESFKTDYVDFLEDVYDEQNDDLPVQLQYGFDAEDKSQYSIDMDLEFPLAAFPPLVIKLGGGLEATNSRNYKLADGYWVKGLPYLQYEMPDPPQPGTNFVEVMQDLWNNVISGNVLQELTDVILAHLQGTFFNWLGNRSEQVIELNDRGTTLTINENSIPTGVDSVLCRNWEWYEEPASSDLTDQQTQMINEYNIRLRQIREQAAGLHYGIGGFFKFEPEGEAFGDSTLLSIAYADSEVVDLDETTLGIYWEDDNGSWNQISSTAIPDSNKVKAYIDQFTVYTIAPRLPQGSYILNADPDSLAADGSSTATVTSEVMLNNDGTTIQDGELFTVQSDRDLIITSDADPQIAGIQVAVSAGTIQFTVQADSISTPIVINSYSVNGYATCQMELILYDVSIPDTPVLLSIEPEHKALQLSWQQVTAPDLAGYKIYYDNDQSGVPYNGTANTSGVNSPVTVGLTESYYLNGLTNNETYYISITAFDVSGTESNYANEVSVTPELHSVENLNIEKVDTGIKLSWDAVYNAHSYKIYRGTEPDMDISNMDMKAQVSTTNWTDTDIAGASSYFYRVVVVAY